MKLTKNKKILIVGLGLIGGSYATILSKKGYEVGAITLNQEDIDYALNNNIDVTINERPTILTLFSILLNNSNLLTTRPISPAGIHPRTIIQQ